MVDDAKNVRIIDWEYAANNDQYWDLSLLAFENFFDKEKIREMIAIHDDVCTPAAEAKVTLYGVVVGVTWGFWAALQARISAIPFDFAKYSDLIFLRTRHHMRQTAWEDALGTL